VTALRPPVAVLCSGGLDSAVLLVDMARTAGESVPVFVRAGHVWEAAERAALERFLAAVDEPRIGAVRDLALPMDDVYGAHWSMTGRNAPGWAAPDAEVELRGRNLILLSKALVLATVEAWPTVVLGTLAGNPFPDATPSFFAKVASAASQGLRAVLTVDAPYRELTKADVVRRGADLPLELTLSCLRPTPAGLHCGDCNKCRERVEAFGAAGVADRTVYARAR
jgi:7-cyano-7-deazaguanine synthase